MKSIIKFLKNYVAEVASGATDAGADGVVGVVAAGTRVR